MRLSGQPHTPSLLRASRLCPPQPSPPASHQGPPSSGASGAPGCAAGPGGPGGDPGGRPHLLGCAQPGDAAPGELMGLAHGHPLLLRIRREGPPREPETSSFLHQMLSVGRSNRATAATAMNQRSSRSHALVTLTLRGTAPPRGPGTAGTRAPRIRASHRQGCGRHIHGARAGSPLQGPCTWWTWRAPSAPGRPRRRGRRAKTGKARSVCGRLGPLTAPCWRWEA